VLPIRSRDAAKTRLGLALDPEERDVLVLGMLADTVRVLAEWPPCHRIHVVTSDYAVTDVIARRFGSMVTVGDPGTGLNGAMTAGRDAAVAAGATAVLMLPADLPLLHATALNRLLDAADATLAAGNGRPIVVIAPADARTGTNALLLAPPTIISPHFGPDSFEAHLRAAHAADASVQVLDDPLLGFDLDTPDDLERLDLARRLELEQIGDEVEDELAFAAAG
jgi:2-phospho-L-lactate/phosphoenolpyruvate guanylyltransferase